VEALFWRHFSNAHLPLQKGSTTSHVLPVWLSKIVRLQWARFWPNLLDLGLMERWMGEGSLPEVGPICVMVMVRLPWTKVIEQHDTQPMVAQRAFHSLVLSILTKAVSRSGNYANSRASTEKLLHVLAQQCAWAK